MTDQVKGFYDHFRTIMAEHAKPITPEIGMPQVTGMTRDKFREELARRGGFRRSNWLQRQASQPRLHNREQRTYVFENTRLLQL